MLGAKTPSLNPATRLGVIISRPPGLVWSIIKASAPHQPNAHEGTGLKATSKSPAPSSHASMDLVSCSSLSEMRQWLQQQISAPKADPGQAPHVAAVAEKVAELWRSSCEEDPKSMAEYAEVAPLAIAYTLTNSGGLKARAAVQCTIALGKLPAVDPTVLLPLVEPSGIRQGLSAVPPSELVTLLEVLAGVRTRPGNALLGAIMSELGTGMGQLPGPALASLLWALVVLGVKPTATWLEAHEAACRATLQELSPQHLGRLSWASGRLGLTPGPAWLAGFCGASSHALAHARWEGSQLCGFMEGCAALPALGAVATQLWRQELLKVSGTLLPELSASHLVAVLRTVVKLELRPEPAWLEAAWGRAYMLLAPPSKPALSSSGNSGSGSSSGTSSSSSSSSSGGSGSGRGGVRGNQTRSRPAGLADVGSERGTAGAAFNSRDLADLLPALLQLSHPCQQAQQDWDADEEEGGSWDRDLCERQLSNALASSRAGGAGVRGAKRGGSGSKGSAGAAAAAAAGAAGMLTAAGGLEGLGVGGLPTALVGPRSTGSAEVAGAATAQPSQAAGPHGSQGRPTTPPSPAADTSLTMTSSQTHAARQPSAAWLSAYLQAVQHSLPRMPAEALPKVLRVVARAGASPGREWLDAYAAALAGKGSVLSAPAATSAALLLLQLAGLRPCPAPPSPPPLSGPSTSPNAATHAPSLTTHLATPFDPHNRAATPPGSPARPSKATDGVSVAPSSSAPSSPAAAAAAAAAAAPYTGASGRRKGGPGYITHSPAGLLAGAQGRPVVGSPALAAVLRALWDQISGPNAASLSDGHMVQSVLALSARNVLSSSPQQEKAALHALQPRLPRLPCQQLIGLGEAVLKLNMQPDSRWWSDYLSRLEHCLQQHTPLAPLACGVVLWTIVTAGLQPHDKLLRLLSTHIRAAVSGTAAVVSGRVPTVPGRARAGGARAGSGRAGAGRNSAGGTAILPLRQRQQQ